MQPRKPTEPGQPDSPSPDAGLVEERPGASYTVAPSGSILSWNAGAEALYGHLAADIIGASFLETLVPPQDLEQNRRWLATAFDASATSHECVRLRKDGQLLHVEVSARSMLGPDGQRRLILSERDTTQIRHQWEARVLEARFRGFMEAAPDAMMLVDEEGRIALANPQAERMLGYSREELLGQPVEMLVPQRFRAGHPAHRAGYFRSPGTRPMGIGMELSARRKDGSELPVEISLSPLVVDNRTLAIAAIRDVSMRRKSDGKFRALLEAAPDAMVIVDARGTITLVNSQTERLFGYDRAELLGHPVDMLVPDRFRPTHHLHRDGYFADPHPRPMGGGLDLWGRRKDGSEFPVEISLSPVETEEGTLTTAAVRDISERLRHEETKREVSRQRTAQEEIRRQNEDLEQRVRERTSQLEAANQELEAFTYSVSHDLRAPVRQIDGFSSILMEQAGGQLDPKSAHYLTRIQEGAAHMGRLVDDLLFLARVGRQNLQTRETSLRKVADTVIAELRPDAGERQVRWVIGDLPSVDCDPGLMKIVFTNLLSNALKYSRPRAEAVVEVGSRTDDGRVVLFVRDNGVGFSMKYADKLFGVFQRLHRTDQFEGTGVGLATVQRIIRKHGGTIWAEAELDHGATFSFTLNPVTRTPEAGA
jgi:PAS domain S-box-containing protein